MHKMRLLMASCSLAVALASADNESFGGIGVTITPSASGVLVVDVIPGSPAALASLHPDDQITAVDGQFLAGLTIDQSRNLLRGLSGSSMQIEYLRGTQSASTSLKRVPLQIVDLDAQKITSWYGKSTNLSGDELGYLASKESESSLLGVMQNGRVIDADATVSAEQLQGVYMESVAEQDQGSNALNALAGSELRSFDRETIRFELRAAGSATLRLLDAQGQSVAQLSLEQGLQGVNTLNWNGKALSSGRYLLRIEHQGSVSGYPVYLR